MTFQRISWKIVRPIKIQFSFCNLMYNLISSLTQLMLMNCQLLFWLPRLVGSLDKVFAAEKKVKLDETNLQMEIFYFVWGILYSSALQLTCRYSYSVLRREVVAYMISLKRKASIPNLKYNRILWNTSYRSKWLFQNNNRCKIYELKPIKFHPHLLFISLQLVKRNWSATLRPSGVDAK